MNATKIEYLHFTWSPLVGCSGKDCAVYAHCFAKKFKKRNLLKCPECYAFKPHTHFERLGQPLTTKIPRRIGVCFSADFWDEGFTIQDRKQVFSTVIEAKQHWFINLTKQPQNIPSSFAFPKNWVQGVSVNRREDVDRIGLLKKTEAPLKIISFEPLYEDLGTLDLEGIDWVIIGAQTHPLVLPEMSDLANVICAARIFKIPIFIKNNIPCFNAKQYPKELSLNVNKQTEEVKL